MIKIGRNLLKTSGMFVDWLFKRRTFFVFSF